LQFVWETEEYMLVEQLFKDDDPVGHCEALRALTSYPPREAVLSSGGAILEISSARVAIRCMEDKEDDDGGGDRWVHER
jgi:hypothetical protein